MKTITLNEKSYNKLKKRLVSEISYGTVDHAYDRSDDIFWEARSAFEDFYIALDDAINKVKYESGNEEQTSNPYLNKIKKCADIIDDIFRQKKLQQDNFLDATQSFDREKFYNNEDNEDYIEDTEMNYLRKKYPKDN